MKTKKELNALKEKIQTASKELRMLSDDELEQVTGGGSADDGNCGRTVYLGNGRCRSKITRIGLEENPCVGCKYA